MCHNDKTREMIAFQARPSSSPLFSSSHLARSCPPFLLHPRRLLLGVMRADRGEQGQIGQAGGGEGGVARGRQGRRPPVQHHADLQDRPRPVRVIMGWVQPNFSAKDTEVVNPPSTFNSLGEPVTKVALPQARTVCQSEMVTAIVAAPSLGEGSAPAWTAVCNTRRTGVPSGGTGAPAGGTGVSAPCQHVPSVPHTVMSTAALAGLHPSGTTRNLPPEPASELEGEGGGPTTLPCSFAGRTDRVSPYAFVHV
jgi:hypothetical protein